MLLDYFHFREQPFGSTPDPRFLYQSPTHREALASLEYGFYSNRGFTTLIAPPGMGKTTLLFSFLGGIRESARTVFLFHTLCNPQELICYILRDLGVTPSQDQVEMHQRLNDVLITEARAGRKFVLVIDEAQNLSEVTLESVRLLTNFETPSTKLMQIVLSGQPQLSGKLASPSLCQLRQRISTVCRLEPFTAEQTRAYIDHRLKIAGYSGAPLFAESALSLITKASNGIPRTINNLCFNGLSLCRALKRKQVDRDMVEEVIGDLELITPTPETIAASHDLAARPRHESEQQSKVRWLAKICVPVAVSLIILALVSVRLPRLHEIHYSKSVNVAASPSPIAAAAAKISATDGVVSLSQAPLEVTVEPRQTLREIAVRYLGGFDDDRLRRIQMLNPSITDPNLIQSGQKIRLSGLVPSPVNKKSQPASARRLQ